MRNLIFLYYALFIVNKVLSMGRDAFSQQQRPRDPAALKAELQNLDEATLLTEYLERVKATGLCGEGWKRNTPPYIMTCNRRLEWIARSEIPIYLERLGQDFNIKTPEQARARLRVLQPTFLDRYLWQRRGPSLGP
jgi:hypothetical protein